MFLTAFLVTGTLSAAADDYPYLTFETADGTKTSVSASSLTISVGDGKLTVGSQEFTLSDLSKMYFSASDETTSGIDDLNSESTSQRTTIFDLQGRKVKGLRIGASGWMGSHGAMTVINDAGQPALASVPLNRYALSAEYDKDEYTFRAEYIHSQGWGSGVAGNTTVNYTLGDKADGWYAFGIVPVIKSKLHLKGRYQTYRKSKEWSTSKTMYEIGANYFFTKNLQLNFEYAFVNDRSIANADKHNYNFVDLQMAFRF